MSEVMIPIKGGGGTSSDDLTATKAQVLEGYTAVTKDSDDEAAGGTMQNLTDRASIQYESGNFTKVIAGDAVFKAKNTDNIDRICIRYTGNAGYITSNTLFAFPSTNFGTAAAENVLDGQTFTSSLGLRISGTMPNRGGNQFSKNKYVWGDNLVIWIPYGYYSGWQNASDGTSCAETYVAMSDFGTVAASNVRSGNTFTSTAGIKVSGTMSVQSAISFSAAAISYNTIRISWKNPSKGPWQGVFIQISTSGYPGTGGGSRAYTGSGWQNQSVASGSNYVDITGLNPSTAYYFTCTSYCDALGWGSSYNVSATTNAITVEAILSGKWSTGSSMTAELISDSKYYMYNKYLDKISGNHIYTTNNQHYARGSSYSSPNYSYFTLYDLSGVTQTQVDQLNTYFNRMNTYKNTASAYSDTVFKSGVTVSFSLVSSTQIQVNMGTKGPFYIDGPQHVYFYKA